jgi:Uma2 family endonuclease
MAQVREKLSLEEFRALPEQKPYLEYWNGEIVQKMAPQRSHHELQDEIAARLREYRRERGGHSGPEPTIAFANPTDTRELIPDVAYWAPEKPVGGPIMQPPTLAVEIRSSGQSATLLRGKCRYYRANGVDAAWLVDPESRTVEVFDAERDGVALRKDDTLESPDLPGFALPLKELFAVLDDG